MLVAHTRLELRFRDLDLLGHLNQAAYHDLLGEARAGFFVAATGGRLMDYVVRRVELDYLAEIGAGHRHVDIRTEALAVGARSLTLSHEIVRPDGVVSAAGLSVMVAFDRVARTARPVPAAERELFQATATVT
jgi:acyl-CoA thioester hydrolase